VLTGSKEYIGEYTVGVSVDPESPAQIADTVKLLLGNPEIARQMGQAGKHAVAEKLIGANERDRLLALYRNILDSRVSNVSCPTNLGKQNSPEGYEAAVKLSSLVNAPHIAGYSLHRP
jgi:hypothetical protein